MAPLGSYGPAWNLELTMYVFVMWVKVMAKFKILLGGGEAAWLGDLASTAHRGPTRGAMGECRSGGNFGRWASPTIAYSLISGAGEAGVSQPSQDFEGELWGGDSGE